MQCRHAFACRFDNFSLSKTHKYVMNNQIPDRGLYMQGGIPEKLNELKHPVPKREAGSFVGPSGTSIPSLILCTSVFS